MYGGVSMPWAYVLLLLAFSLMSCSKGYTYEANSSLNAAVADDELTLKLSAPIDSKSFGLEANPKIDGKSLFEVITSQEAGREDGQLCSACHNNELALGGYGVDQDPNTSISTVDPDAEISGRAWTGKGGWAERFSKNPTKPENIKTLLKYWINGGYEI